MVQLEGNPVWGRSFKIETGGSASRDGGIRLEQVGRKTFVLGSTITYIGERTGLENLGLPAGSAQDKDIRRVQPSQLLPDTDLASVPGPLRWFMNSYGAHTPAALIHDRLIPTDGSIPEMTDTYADTYFRFMLEDLGVSWLKRWLMWTAVAFRTRYNSRRATMLLWVALSLAGITAFTVGLATLNLPLLILSLLAPFPIAILWRRQYPAGLLAAACAPFILPPALVAAAGYGVYLIAESSIGLVFPGGSKSSLP